MTRRTKAQWRTLIEEQQTSGLIAAEFCRQHDVNAKYFSLRKRQLFSDSPTVFIKANPARLVKEVAVPESVYDGEATARGLRLRVIDLDLSCVTVTDQTTLSKVLDQLLR